ncbi:MAG: hypothetical protein AABY22_17130 [Nanoarchaeota archaeon]
MGGSSGGIPLGMWFGKQQTFPFDIMEFGSSDKCFLVTVPSYTPEVAGRFVIAAFLHYEDAVKFLKTSIGN